MTPTPRTVAGRLLLMAGLTFHSGRRLADYPQMIVDIEAQAAPPDALREALEHLLKTLGKYEAAWMTSRGGYGEVSEAKSEARAALAAPATAPAIDVEPGDTEEGA